METVPFPGRSLFVLWCLSFCFVLHVPLYSSFLHCGCADAVRVFTDWLRVSTDWPGECRVPLPYSWFASGVLPVCVPGRLVRHSAW